MNIESNINTFIVFSSLPEMAPSVRVLGNIERVPQIECNKFEIERRFEH